MPLFRQTRLIYNIYGYDVKLMRARVSELSFFVAGKAQLLYSLETSFPPHDRQRRADRENEKKREKKSG